MAKILKKKTVERDVLTMARERISYIYDKFDHVAVSFSGGKDSTVILNLTLEEARRRGRVPLDVFFWDEEAIHPETVEYVERVASRPDVALRWYCVPVRHRNACSRRSPYWYPWAEEDRDRWCRPLPPRALTERDLPGYTRRPIPECNPLLFHPAQGTVAVMMGIRASESIRRYRSVASKALDNYCAPDPADPHRFITLVKPIYDWLTADVWTAPRQFGWDYNRTYDVMSRAGIAPNDQRVCPPYGEEPLGRLWTYAVCWPDLWERMIHRVPGAATAARYSRTALYGFGDLGGKPDGLSWREAIQAALRRWPPKERRNIAERLQQEMELHAKKINSAAIPDTEPHPITGLSWRFLYMLAVRGDLKGRRSVLKQIQRPQPKAAGHA